MTPFKLKIAEPCHESWNEMNAQEKGKFCKVCDKTVIDFTNKSLHEISNHLQNATGKVCGRFNTKDLNVVYTGQTVSTPTLTLKPKWFTWLAVFAFLGFGKKAEACLTPNSPLYQPKNPDQLLVKKGATIIKGQIKRSDTKTGIAEVEIKVYSGGKIIAVSRSFVNGSYFINVPENTIFDFKVDVEYNAVNYVAQVLKDLPIQKQEIVMDINMMAINPMMYEKTMGDVMMVREELNIVYEQQHLDRVRTNIEYHTMGAVVLTNYINIEPIYQTNETKIVEDSVINQSTINNIFQIKAYPNPTANSVTIETENIGQVSIQLFDFNGKLIQSYSSQESKNVIDLTNQPNGTYIVRVIDDATNKWLQKKIIKIN